MSRTKSLILLLSSAILLAGCGYGFVLQGGGNLKAVTLEQSVNTTKLLEAALVMDSELERGLGMQGLLKHAGQNAPSLRATIVSTSSRQISSTDINATDRYRLTVNVKAELRDAAGKVIWQSYFAGDGDYSQGGQEEDALEAACRSVAEQLARQLATINI